MKQKYYVELNRQEWRLIIEGLNRFRNKLIAAGRYTDAVDEILIKVATALPAASTRWPASMAAFDKAHKAHKALSRGYRGTDISALFCRVSGALHLAIDLRVGQLSAAVALHGL